MDQRVTGSCDEVNASSSGQTMLQTNSFVIKIDEHFTQARQAITYLDTAERESLMYHTHTRQV